MGYGGLLYSLLENFGRWTVFIDLLSWVIFLRYHRELYPHLPM